MKHTPGPWSVRNKGGRESVISNPAGNEATNGTFIADCMVSSAYRTIEETKANAKLIAAAPELLEAARKMVEAFKDKQFDDSSDPMRTAKWALLNAIEKAEGK